MNHPYSVGIHIDGARRASVGVPEESGADALTGAWAKEIVQRTEIAGLSFATFAGSHLARDGNRLDPVHLAAFAGPLTSRIAVIPEIPVTYVEPFHTSTQLASLDFAAGGRGGWLVSAENSEAAAIQYGRTVLDRAALAGEVVDVVAAVRRLWDTWEDDAVIRDFATGRYIDRERLHYADFTGRSFSVKGPAITPRPPQGQLPVLVPLEHAPGVDADVVIVGTGPGLVGDVERARSYGAPRVIADLEVVLDSRGESADRRATRDGSPGRFVGTAAELIDLLRDLAQQVDGVRLIPFDLDRELDELAHVVIPALIAAGVFTPPGRADARSIFGLSRAQNVFASTGRN